MASAEQVDMTVLDEVVREASRRYMFDTVAAHRIRLKGPADYVTEVDSSIQNYIKNELAERYPDIQFTGEENNDQDADFNGLVWALDPVDGTTNLIHHMHHSAISLALLDGGAVIKAVIYQPYLDEMFTAELGKGAFLNGKPIHVSAVADLGMALIGLGTSHKGISRAEAAAQFQMFGKVFESCADIRRSGSASLDLAWVAAGRLDGFLERDVKLWDHAAGRLLVTEAGGVVTNWQGGDLGSAIHTSIVAGNPYVAEHLREVFLQ